MATVQCPGCRAEISDQATACPGCGRPMRRKQSRAAIGCLTILGLIFVIAAISAIIQTGSSRPSGPSTLPSTSVIETRGRATQQLVNRTDWADNRAVADLCEAADIAALQTSVRSRCVDAHVAVARQYLTAQKIAAARKALNFAVREGLDLGTASGIEQPLKRAEEREARTKRDAEIVAGDLARQAYAKALRERYLDQNLDIKVEVSGKLHDRLTLRFVLFNDVWAHKFQKGDLVDEVRRLGFKRVDMTDGYDYHVYWELK